MTGKWWAPVDLWPYHSHFTTPMSPLMKASFHEFLEFNRWIILTNKSFRFTHFWVEPDTFSNEHWKKKNQSRTLMSWNRWYTVPRFSRMGNFNHTILGCLATWITDISYLITVKTDMDKILVKVAQTVATHNPNKDIKNIWLLKNKMIHCTI